MENHAYVVQEPHHAKRGLPVTPRQARPRYSFLGEEAVAAMDWNAITNERCKCQGLKFNRIAKELGSE